MSRGTYGIANTLGYSGSLAQFLDDNYRQSMEIANRVQELYASVPLFDITPHSSFEEALRRSQDVIDRLSQVPDSVFSDELKETLPDFERIRGLPFNERWEQALAQIDSLMQPLVFWTSGEASDDTPPKPDAKRFEVPQSAAAAIEAAEPCLPEHLRTQAKQIADFIRSKKPSWYLKKIWDLFVVLVALYSGILTIYDHHKDKGKTEPQADVSTYHAVEDAPNSCADIQKDGQPLGFAGGKESEYDAYQCDDNESAKTNEEAVLREAVSRIISGVYDIIEVIDFDAEAVSDGDVEVDTVDAGNDVIDEDVLDDGGDGMGKCD